MLITNPKIYLDYAKIYVIVELACLQYVMIIVLVRYLESVPDKKALLEIHSLPKNTKIAIFKFGIIKVCLNEIFEFLFVQKWSNFYFKFDISKLAITVILSYECVTQRSFSVLYSRTTLQLCFNTRVYFDTNKSSCMFILKHLKTNPSNLSRFLGIS